MPTIRDEAIVIRRWDWSETSQSALLFCREHGLLRGLAKGAKREKGAFSGGLEPLTRGEVVAIVKPRSELATLTEWDLREVFWRVRRDAGVFRVAHYIADLIAMAITDADPHPALWDESLHALRAVESDGCDAQALARFQWALLRETGYQPDLSGASGDAADAYETFEFDPERGVLAAPGGGAGDDAWRIRAGTVRYLLSLPGGTGESEPFDAATVDRANRFLASCIRRALGEEPRTLRLVFGGSILGSDQPPGRRSRRSGR